MFSKRQLDVFVRPANEHRVVAHDDNALSLKPIDPTTLVDKPAPERLWLVKDWIEMERVTGLPGAGGEGKTLLAQMPATACDIGGQWLGLPVRSCNSLLFYCEDDQDEIHRRRLDINRYYNCNFADLGAVRWLPRLDSDISFKKLGAMVEGAEIAAKRLWGRA